MLAANNLWDPKDLVINELSARLKHMVLVAAFVLMANQTNQGKGWSKLAV